MTDTGENVRAGEERKLAKHRELQDRRLSERSIDELPVTEVERLYKEQMMLPPSLQREDWWQISADVIERLDEERGYGPNESVAVEGRMKGRLMDVPEKVQFVRNLAYENIEDVSIEQVNAYREARQDVEGLLLDPRVDMSEIASFFQFGEWGYDDMDEPSPRSRYKTASIAPSLCASAPREADFSGRIDADKLYETVQHTTGETWDVDPVVLKPQETSVNAHGEAGEATIRSHTSGNLQLNYDVQVQTDDGEYLGIPEIEGIRDAVITAQEDLTGGSYDIVTTEAPKRTNGQYERDQARFVRFKTDAQQEVASYHNAQTPGGVGASIDEDSLGPALDRITALDAEIAKYRAQQ